jgi:tetratricopeptide (TPR) repeat protein
MRRTDRARIAAGEVPPSRRARPARCGSVARGAALALLVAAAGWAPRPGAAADFAAAAPFSVPAPELVAAAQEAAADSASPIVVLWSGLELRFDEEGRAASTRHLVYRIGPNRDLGDWGVVAAGWEPWHQRRPELAARVVAPSGTESRLDPAAAVERSAGGDGVEVFSEARRLEAPLPGLVTGAVVEESTTVSEFQPYFRAGRSLRLPLSSGAPVRGGRVVLSVPIAIPLRWRVEGGAEVEKRERVEGDRRVVEIGFGPLEPVDGREEGLPGDVAPWPVLRVSVGGGWGEIAAAYAEIVEAALEGAEVEGWVEAGRAAERDREAIATRLLDRLRREIRYTGLELGEGGLVPRPPAQTLSSRFGDCKDQAVLLVALLRAAGIPAEVALLAAGPGLDVSPELPGLGEFDHAIVHVPGPSPLWIDPTARWVPIGELPVADQGRWALVASRRTRELVRTPVAGSATNRWIEDREIRLAERGRAEVVESAEYAGSWGADLRADYADAEEARIREVLEGYVESEYSADGLAEWTMVDPEDLSRPWRIDLRATGAARGSSGEDDAAVALFPAHLLRGLPATLAAPDEGQEEPERRHDLEVTPIRIEWRYRIVPPPGFRLRELPEATELAMGPARHWRELRQDADGAITGVLGLELPKRRWTPEEVASFRAARAELARTPAQLVLFDRESSRLLAEGRIAEAIREIRHLIELHPGEALHRSQLALAVLAGGLGEMARVEARRAIEESPEDAFAHRTLGWVLQHDPWGRRFAAGADRDGALAAYRRAVELDPQDEIAWADLAILHEHDESGRQHSPAANLEEAIRIHRHLRDELGSKALEVNLALDLFHLERDAELIGLATSAEVPLELEVAAHAVESGVDRALQVARRKAAGVKERTAAVGAAARHLIGRRRYPQAAELLRSGVGDQMGAEQAAAISLIERARAIESVPPDHRDPRDLFRRTLMLVADGTPSPDAVRAVLSRRVGEVPDEFDARELRSIARQAAGAGLPVRAALDLGLATAETVVDGDEATGYRIRVSMGLGSAAPGTRMLAIVEDGEPRLIGSDQWEEAAAEYVLERIEAGELAVARTWLEWLAEGKAAPVEGDPLSGDPVRRLWPVAAADARSLRLAGLALLARGGGAERALAAIESELPAASDRERPGLEHALVVAATEANEDERALAVLESMAGRHPRADSVLAARVRALGRLGRWQQVDEVLAGRLATDAADPVASRLRAHALAERGELVAAVELFEQLERRGHAEPTDLNTLAWLGLALPDRLVAATGRAERAARETDFASYAVLNTLAAVYARNGRITEALQVWKKSLEVADQDEPGAPDLFVLGLLAESYGLADVARELHRRALDPEGHDSPISTSSYAAERLRALGEGGPGGDGG